MNTFRPPLFDTRYTGWRDDYHPTPMPIILPPKRKDPAQSGFQFNFKRPSTYGKDYMLIFPEEFANRPKNQFPFNTPHANAFPDAWIKP